jgi:hypothetical protein
MNVDTLALPWPAEAHPETRGVLYGSPKVQMPYSNLVSITMSPIPRCACAAGHCQGQRKPQSNFVRPRITAAGASPSPALSYLAWQLTSQSKSSVPPSQADVSTVQAYSHSRNATCGTRQRLSKHPVLRQLASPVHESAAHLVRPLARGLQTDALGELDRHEHTSPCFAAALVPHLTPLLTPDLAMRRPCCFTPSSLAL